MVKSMHRPYKKQLKLKEEVYANCASAWAKAVPCVAGSVHVSMLYLSITFILNTTEL